MRSFNTSCWNYVESITISFFKCIQDNYVKQATLPFESRHIFSKSPKKTFLCHISQLWPFEIKRCKFFFQFGIFHRRCSSLRKTSRVNEKSPLFIFGRQSLKSSNKKPCKRNERIPFISTFPD